MHRYKSWNWIGIAAALSCAGLAHAKGAKFDPPDLNLEHRLHKQFLRGKNQLGNVTPQGLNESYRLQKGETLWTLSEMLYGDGHYWPRVWAQNQGISNPHLVRPGHQLQFLMGSEDETPAFRFSEDGDEGGLELTAAGDSGAQNPIVEIPPPEVPPKPVLKVPGSFPEWQSIFRKRPDRFLDDRGLKATEQKIPDRIYLSGYVQEKPVDSLGTYLENDAEAGLPITNQYVYVKVKKGVGHAGMKMLVVKDMGRLKRLNSQWDPDERPYVVQVQAEIELRETTPARFSSGDREKYEAYRALVTKTTGLAANDCVLIQGQLEVISLEMKGDHGTTTAQVIGSVKHQASALYGPGDLVFLNKGSSQGVAPGQLLDVYADRSIRRKYTMVTHSPVPSGTLKVVKVTGTLATAVLLEVRDSIQQGDLVKEVSNRRDTTEELEHIRGDGPSAADDDDFAERKQSRESVPSEDSVESEIESVEEF